MNSCQKQLITILASTINSRKPHISYEEFNWHTLFEEAKKHDIYSFLYPYIKEICPDIDVLKSWQKSALLSGMKQIQHIEEITRIIKEFNKISIPVIILKGLYLRRFYPEPELRTMLDADIYIHESDLKNVKKILIDSGYKLKSIDSACLHFEHNMHFPLEVHISMFRLESFYNVDYYENSIWENALSFELNNTPTLVLSPNDNILYLCFHMAKHFLSYGFGIRFLCDLVLFLDSHRNEINWEQFIKNSESLGILSFNKAIFLIIKKIFLYDIPEEMFDRSIDNENLSNFIDDILDSGIHGHGSAVRHIGNRLMYSSLQQMNKSKLRYFLSFMFPPYKKLGPRYSYARKLPLLYPAAWIHRLFYNLLYNNLITIIKTSLTSSGKSITVMKKRQKLIKWLDMKQFSLKYSRP